MIFFSVSGLKNTRVSLKVCVKANDYVFHTQLLLFSQNDFVFKGDSKNVEQETSLLTGLVRPPLAAELSADLLSFFNGVKLNIDFSLRMMLYLA